MTRYLLDTNMVGHFIDHRRGVDARVREARSRSCVFGTCTPVVAELFYGVEFSASGEINRPRLIRGLGRIRCWPFDRKAAEECGRIAAELRKIGRPMQQIDSGMSQAIFAQVLNVSTKTVQSWEQGQRKPSHAALRLIQVFREDPSSLVEIVGMSYRKHASHR